MSTMISSEKSINSSGGSGGSSSSCTSNSNYDTGLLEGGDESLRLYEISKPIKPHSSLSHDIYNSYHNSDEDCGCDCGCDYDPYNVSSRSRWTCSTSGSTVSEDLKQDDDDNNDNDDDISLWSDSYASTSIRDDVIWEGNASSSASTALSVTESISSLTPSSLTTSSSSSSASSLEQMIQTLRQELYLAQLETNAMKDQLEDSIRSHSRSSQNLESENTYLNILILDLKKKLSKSQGQEQSMLERLEQLQNEKQQKQQQQQYKREQQQLEEQRLRNKEKEKLELEKKQQQEQQLKSKQNRRKSKKKKRQQQQQQQQKQQRGKKQTKQNIDKIKPQDIQYEHRAKVGTKNKVNSKSLNKKGPKKAPSKQEHDVSLHQQELEMSNSQSDPLKALSLAPKKVVATLPLSKAVGNGSEIDETKSTIETNILSQHEQLRRSIKPGSIKTVRSLSSQSSLSSSSTTNSKSIIPFETKAPTNSSNGDNYKVISSIASCNTCTTGRTHGTTTQLKQGDLIRQHVNKGSNNKKKKNEKKETFSLGGWIFGNSNKSKETSKSKTSKSLSSSYAAALWKQHKLSKKQESSSKTPSSSSSSIFSFHLGRDESDSDSFDEFDDIYTNDENNNNNDDDNASKDGLSNDTVDNINFDEFIDYNMILKNFFQKVQDPKTTPSDAADSVLDRLFDSLS